MKKLLFLLLLLLCACAPQGGTTTSSSQFNGIMSVPLLSIPSRDFELSAPSVVSEETYSSMDHPTKYPLQYPCPRKSSIATLVTLLNDPIRKKDDISNKEDILQFLKCTLPLGIKLTDEIILRPLNPAIGVEANIILFEGEVYETAYSPPAHCEYDSISDMKNLLQHIFTEDYLEKAYEHTFEIIEEDDYKRGPFYLERDGQLYVRSNEDMTWNCTDVEWQLDTLEIISSSENELVISMKYLYSYHAPYISWYQSEIHLLKENGIWKYGSTPGNMVDFMEETDYSKYLNQELVDFEACLHVD